MSCLVVERGKNFILPIVIEIQDALKEEFYSGTKIVHVVGYDCYITVNVKPLELFKFPDFAPLPWHDDSGLFAQCHSHCFLQGTSTGDPAFLYFFLLRSLIFFLTRYEPHLQRERAPSSASHYRILFFPLTFFSTRFSLFFYDHWHRVDFPQCWPREQDSCWFWKFRCFQRSASSGHQKERPKRSER